MRVTYIHHSSFLMEDSGHSFLFDYFEGYLPDIRRDKPLYVFASHRHGDHFSPEIFKLAEEYPDTSYILSADIWKKRIPESLQQRTTFLKPDEELQLDDVKISTLKSTDEGVAFIVSTEGKTIYHAGDLNDWYWAEEGDDWNTKMSKAYHAQIEKLRGVKLDIACVPVDPRLDAAYTLGADELIEITVPTYLFPMHFWEDFSVCEKLKTHWQEKGYATEVMEIVRKGQAFNLPS